MECCTEFAGAVIKSRDFLPLNFYREFTMQAQVRWTSGMQFVAEAGSGHAIVVDGPPDLGGRDTGVRPMELMLMSIGACSAIDVIHILKKSRQPVVDCRVQVSAERADTEPKVFTKIHLHFQVVGEGMKEVHVKRAVDLSAEKYCSASLMLSKACPVTHGYSIETELMDEV